MRLGPNDGLTHPGNTVLFGSLNRRQHISGANTDQRCGQFQQNQWVAL